MIYHKHNISENRILKAEDNAVKSINIGAHNPVHSMKKCPPELFHYITALQLVE